MKEDKIILDIDDNKIHNVNKYVSYWRFEILLTKGVFIIELISFLALLLALAPSPNELFFLIILGPISHFFLGCWHVINGIIFCFLDNANYKMRYKYLMYAIGTLLLIIPCGMLAEYLDNFNDILAWGAFFLINIAILPLLVAAFYIKTLRKSIALAKA